MQIAHPVRSMRAVRPARGGGDWLCVCAARGACVRDCPRPRATGHSAHWWDPFTVCDLALTIIASDEDLLDGGFASCGVHSDHGEKLSRKENPERHMPE